MIMIDNWPISVRVGIVFVASALPLLGAAYYARASLLYDRKEEPGAVMLGILGGALAIGGGGVIFYPFTFRSGFLSCIV
jgi:hypothetical protein